VKHLALAAVAIAVVAVSASAAQLYRWVDEKGRVEWRDTPPPPDAKSVEQRKVIANTIESSMPYALQQAIRKFPLTLWTTECGEPCAQATAHLARRGVPYTLRDARKEPDALQKATGGREVPVLFVGSQQLKGYLESAWDAALDGAGYPQAPLRGVKPPAASR
jgi:glutaredoxin